jgi:hypothetical protein
MNKKLKRTEIAASGRTTDNIFPDLQDANGSYSLIMKTIFYHGSGGKSIKNM